MERITPIHEEKGEKIKEVNDILENLNNEKESRLEEETEEFIEMGKYELEKLEP